MEKKVVYVIEFLSDGRLFVADSWDSVQDIMFRFFCSFDSVKISRCLIKSSLK